MNSTAIAAELAAANANATRVRLNPKSTMPVVMFHGPWDGRPAKLGLTGAALAAQGDIYASWVDHECAA